MTSLRSDKYKIIVFDLDGTLARSKLPIGRAMASLLAELIQKKKGAVIGGGKMPLFRRQILRPMAKNRPNFENLYLFPTNGAALFRYKGGWRRVYEVKLTADEAQRIKRALGLALAAVHFKYPKRKFGVLIENRGTQITFSALGQRAPLPLKGKWNRDSDIRPKITQALKKLLPDFEVREGGLTSIDVTKKGIDKGYAVRRLMKILRMRKEDLVFIGDALFPGGNDYSVKKTGILCVRVSNPDETKEVIRNFEFRNRKF